MKMTHAFAALLIVLALDLSACAAPPPPEPTATQPPPTEPPATPTPEPPTATPEPTQPVLIPAPEGQGVIVFSSNRDDPNVLGIYTINPDGSDLTGIDTPFNANYAPSWSPDRSQIAFWQNDSGEELIYVMNADGSGLARVTDFSSAFPVWSPYGDQLVFQSDHDDEPVNTPDIYVINLDGSGLAELVDLPDKLDYQPIWTDDGTRIIFVSNRDGGTQIYQLDIASGEVTVLTEGSDPLNYGELSPDGSKLAFVYGPPTFLDIYVMDVDGSNVVRLTADVASDPDLAWSPDGTRIVFASDRSGNWDLWLINADGTGLTQLTDDPAVDRWPDWR